VIRGARQCQPGSSPYNPLDCRASLRQHERRQGAGILQRWVGGRNHQCTDTYFGAESDRTNIRLRLQGKAGRSVQMPDQIEGETAGGGEAGKRES